MKHIESLMQPIQRSTISPKNDEVLNSVNSLSMFKNQSKKQDKYVYEKLKKDASNFLQCLNISNIDSMDTRVNLE